MKGKKKRERKNEEMKKERVVINVKLERKQKEESAIRRNTLKHLKSTVFNS